MAARGQEQHFIDFDQLKVKYRGQVARIRTYCSVVERQTHTNITIGNARRGPMKFDIVGQQGAIRKAKKFIDGEFIDRSHRPRGAVSGPRLSAECLDVDIQRALVVTDMDAPNLLTESALRRHDLLTGTCQFRQFACRACDEVWWRVVSTTKMVSQCRRCRKRYEAIPRDKEYGIGRFVCQNCTHVFLSRCQATSTCACYECFVDVTKPYIHPKFQLDRPRTVHKHSCDLCNGKGDCPTRRKVVHASKEHDSTGSTVSTFLSQYNFDEDTAPCFSDVSDATGSSCDPDEAGASANGANVMPQFDIDEQQDQ